MSMNLLTVTLYGLLAYDKGDSFKQHLRGLDVPSTVVDEDNLRRFCEASIPLNPSAYNWTPGRFLIEQFPWLRDVRLPHFSDDMDSTARQELFDGWLKQLASERAPHGTIVVPAFLRETLAAHKQQTQNALVAA